MRIGHNHGVSRGIGKGIEDDEVELAAMYDEGFLVVAGVLQLAEDALRHLVNGGDVGVAPRGPKIVHHWALYQSAAASPNGGGSAAAQKPKTVQLNER